MSTFHKKISGKDWEELVELAGDNSANIQVLYSLLKESNPTTEYIPSHLVQQIVTELDLSLKEVWKPVVDFLCMKTDLLELHFQFIDSENQEYDITFDEIQEVMQGNEMEYGGRRYSATALRANTFPYFIPLDKFKRLVAELERA